MDTAKLNLGDSQRAHGVIVTASDPQTGQLHVIHRAGLDGQTLDCLREVCAQIETAGWEVETISTPRSIFADLQGGRYERVVGDDGGIDTASPWQTEMSMLGRIGYLHLLTRRARGTQGDLRRRRPSRPSAA
jgi:hypothetical protein